MSIHTRSIAPPDNQVLRRSYDIFGQEDMFLDFAGRKHAQDTVYEHLAGLKVGDLLVAVPKGDYVELHDDKSVCVAQLSRTTVKAWGGRLESIERITILAMVQRRVEDSGEEFRPRCQCERWEIPVAEVDYLDSK